VGDNIRIGSNTEIGRNVVIHPNVFIGDNVEIGDDSVIQYGAFIERNCVIGNNSRIGTNAVLRRETYIGNRSVFGSLSASEGKNWIGDDVLIHSQCHITTGLVIEDCVFIAPLFVGANDPDMVHYRREVKEFFPQAGYIKFGARIAVGVTINPGVTIGREAVVGSGSVVSKDVLDFSITYGVPAKTKGIVEKKWYLPEARYLEFQDRIGRDGISLIIRKLLNQ